MGATEKISGKNEYVEQTKSFDKTDALLAFAMWLIVLTVNTLLGLVFVKKAAALTETYIFCATGIAALCNIGCVCLLCFLRRQKLSTAGFSRTKLWQSVLLGVALSAIFVILKGIPDFSILQKNGALIGSRVIYYLVFIAFMEEFVFRGYIGTRLFGAFSNKKTAVFITGMLFSLQHIPFQMIVRQATVWQYVSTVWINLIYLVGLHYLFQWLYTKFNSLAAPVLLHFTWDFVLWLSRLS